MPARTKPTKATKRTTRAEPVIDPDLLTVPQVANVLQIGKSTAWELVRSGELRSRRRGRTVRVSRADLADFVSSLPDAYPSTT